MIQNKLLEFEGIELMPHQAYNLNLALSDYYLFQSMASSLQLWHFNNQKELETSLKEFFVSKDKN